MNVLFVAPPQDSRYYNICYNYTELGEVAAYTKKLKNVDKVTVVDLSVKKEKDHPSLISELKEDYDVIALWNRFDNIENLKETIGEIRNNSKNARIVTYGQPSSYIPYHFVANYDIDAVVKNGCWEKGIESFIKHVGEHEHIEDLEGLIAKEGLLYFESPDAVIPDGAFWSFPDLSMLPLNDYFRLYAEEEFTAGIGQKKEISFSLSRGCRGQCEFCYVPGVHGKKENRKDLDSILTYLDNNFEKYNFDFMSIFSPMFTSDRDFVMEFSKEMEKRKIDWKCVTPVRYIDDELVATMHNGGCKRIGFGIETMNPDAQKYIKKFTKKEDIENAIEICHKNSVEPLMFMMLGIPGETRESFVSAVKFLYGLGAKTRVTAYTPYYELKNTMTPEEVAQFNRVSISSENVKGMTKDEFNQVTKHFSSWVKGVL